MIWFNNVRSNHACVNDDMCIEKAKSFGGELNKTGFSYFVEKYFYVLTNSIIRIFSREPKRPEYRDMTAVKKLPVSSQFQGSDTFDSTSNIFFRL